jgi:hypothetical protein
VCVGLTGFDAAIPHSGRERRRRVPKRMRDWQYRKLVEAVHRVRGVVKSFEKTPHPGKFQNRRSAWRDRRKLDVAIALHGLFQDTQQDMDSGAIELP